MKPIPKLLLVALAFAGLAGSALAHTGKKAGPNGGRILTSVTPHAEFFVTGDRKIQLTFLDHEGNTVAPTTQTATVTTGSRSAPTVLKFSRQGDILLSDAPLPPGGNLPAVIQIKTSPEAREVIERFNVNLATCSECKHAEYACTCGH